jgi:hypothetical protein
MTIGERSHFEPARVVYFDSRRGTGRCITQTGRHARIPLGAVRAASITVLDPGDEIYVSIDELNPTRVDALHLPEETVQQPPVKKKKKK